ncbi:IclR family transcriptional regulator [Ulvibacterium marinum]|uniref:IclR family transcriptional regulator n=1 Tax=Ulvibacterium marinum TaxID=2419782 RepID=A0A3B0BX75_9FLAO|nr:IclR family transcriptional regulator [Ulvibacterium marinum]RKN77008.1 IclR family transcriptional regulator [Ulvibacterium marinum]
MIQVVNRALDIIEFIASSGRKDVPLKEIADNLGLNHGTCANIIKTLVTRDYLEKTSERGKGYGLGPMLYFITGDFSYSVDLINAAKSHMHELTANINENCMLGILRNNIRVSLFDVYANQELRVVNQEEKNAYETASGRVLLAFLPSQKTKMFIEKYGLPAKGKWEDVDTLDDFEFELEKIRRKGYALHITKSKVLGIAAPIYRNGEAIASLGVFLPEFRFNDDTKDSIVEAMQQTAQLVSEDLERINSKH